MLTWQQKQQRKKKRLRAARRVAPLFTDGAERCERRDLARKKRRIPADPSAALLKHNRKLNAAACAAKRPHEPRSVQRQKNLKRLEARRALGQALPAVVSSMKPIEAIASPVAA